MIKSTKNNKELVKICRGGQTIWEILPCEFYVTTMKSGDTSVRGCFFPNEGSTISIKIYDFDMETFSDKIIYSNSYSPTNQNYFSFNFPFSLKQGYSVTIEVTNPSCKPTNKTTTIH